MREVTQLLESMRSGDRAAGDQLFALVYDELKNLARSRLARESTLTLEPAQLVNEAYLRLCRQPGLQGRDRHAFFAYASGVIRSVIVDYVRARRAAKRGGDVLAVTLSSAAADVPAIADPDAEALEGALLELAKADPRSARVVELRFYGGMNEDEIAEALEISPATVRRDWDKARAFLYVALKD